MVGEIEKTAIEEFQGIEYSGYGIGTRHLATHGVTADFALLAEPTGMRIAIANMGVMWLRITVGGTVAHSAMANRPGVDQRDRGDARVAGRHRSMGQGL